MCTVLVAVTSTARGDRQLSLSLLKVAHMVWNLKGGNLKPPVVAHTATVTCWPVTLAAECPHC